MTSPIYTSAIYEEKQQEELENCISVMPVTSNVEKRYIDTEREFLNQLFSVVINNKNNFHKLSEEQRGKIKKVAEFLSIKYNKEHNDDNYFYSFLYTMFTLKHNEKNLIFSSDEKLTLFIETIDPELKMYHYYINSKNIDEARKRITSTFGFFDERLCYVEQYYKQKFIDENGNFLKNI